MSTGGLEQAAWSPCRVIMVLSDYIFLIQFLKFYIKVQLVCSFGPLCTCHRAYRETTSLFTMVTRSKRIKLETSSGKTVWNHLPTNKLRRRKKKELRKRNAECSRSLRQSELAFLGPPSMTEPPPPSTLITDLALTYRPHFRHQVQTTGMTSQIVLKVLLASKLKLGFSLDSV